MEKTISRMNEQEARNAAAGLRAWAPHFNADAVRMDAVAGEIRQLLAGPPVGTPGSVNPKHNLIVVPLTNYVPGGILSNTNWIEVSGYTKFNAAGETLRIDIIAFEFTVPAGNKSGLVMDSNMGSSVQYALCDRPGVLVREGTPSQGVFGALTYGGQQWNTVVGDQIGHDLVVGQTYWLCCSHFDPAHFRATGEVKAHDSVFDGRLSRLWTDSFKLQLRV